MAINRSTPENFIYDNTSKINKNFVYKNLKRSKCYNCDFSGSNFDFTSLRGAHFKKCNFYRCSFKEAEFIGSNLKGCKFREAMFEDAIFEGASLANVDFRDAKFINTTFVGCDLGTAKNFDINSPKIRVYDEMPHLDISNELEMAILFAMENEYIKKSRVLDTKDGSINGLSIMILKERFSEETLIKGMKYIKENIDRDFHTLSYISRIIKSMDK